MLGRSLGEKLLELQGIPTAFHSLSQALTESGQARPGDFNPLESAPCRAHYKKAGLWNKAGLV